MEFSTNEKSLKEAIRELLKTYNLTSGLNETRLINSWEKVVGKMISHHTGKIYIRKKTLYVSIDSPAIKNELSYAREKIIESLNNEIGEKVIEDIRFR